VATERVLEAFADASTTTINGTVMYVALRVEHFGHFLLEVLVPAYFALMRHGVLPRDVLFVVPVRGIFEGETVRPLFGGNEPPEDAETAVRMLQLLSRRKALLLTVNHAR